MLSILKFKKVFIKLSYELFWKNSLLGISVIKNLNNSSKDKLIILYSKCFNRTIPTFNIDLYPLNKNKSNIRKSTLGLSLFLMFKYVSVNKVINQEDAKKLTFTLVTFK